jgi:dolichyl-phosphate-mannose--protein O-mannosyl transferase
MSTSALQTSRGKQIALFFLFVTALSYLTYFHRYWNPPAVFWDENYHIASAQKYLHNVYFMEQHPPLGKLLIAAGEWIFHPNARTDQFLGTDYGTDFEPGFSFVGYRFFSAFLAWWTAPILFLIFLLLIKNPLHSALLSFFYIFDNAMIVHTRGAMLEGPLGFFCALTILFFLLTYLQRDDDRKFILWSILFGVAFGLTLSTKVLGLVFITLGIPVLWVLWPRWKRMLAFLGMFLGSAFLIFCSVWWIHFALGTTVNDQLPDGGYYQASQTYKEILAEGKAGSLFSFPIELRDSLAYIPFYNQGAPRIDLCKTDENGSPFYFWPFGGRTINYRWETPDGSAYRYLYLIPNPASWWIAFASLCLAVAMLVGSVLFPPKKPLKQRFLLFVFVALYASFMIGVSRIDRVMYLYHYFIPLIVTFVIAAMVFDEVHAFGKKVLTEHGKTIIALCVAGLIFVSYLFYRPFSYYELITDWQFNARNIFSLWDMSCVNCQKVNGLAVPDKVPGQQ